MRWLANLFRKKESPQTEPEPALPKSLSAAEKKYIAVEVELANKQAEFYQANENLVKKHGMNSPIAWQEVEKLQLDYKRDYERLEKQKEKLEEKFPETRNYDLFDETKEKAAKKLETSANKKLAENSEKTNWQISDNFKKFHDNSAHENTKLNPTTNTKKELVLDLLSKNKGLAVGDCHIEDEAPKLLGGMMKDLKAAGVDTLYIEFSKGTWDLMQKMDDKQLRDYANGKEFNGKRMPTQKEWGESYGATHSSDNFLKEVFLMIAEARKNGIAVVNIDKREVDANGTLRVAHTNLEWTDAIKQDRVQNHKTGKYIVWAGSNHFTDSGAVDDALGIPSIAFDHSINPFGFYKAEKDNGFDYILRGGLDHYEIDKGISVRPADLPLPQQQTSSKEK